MTTYPPNGGHRRLTAVVASAALLLAFTGLLMGNSGQSADAATAPVGLGTAGSYAVLAGSEVTNTGTSTVNANVGVSPGTSVGGFPPGIITGGGVIHSADAPAGQAQSDLTIAYNDAASRSTTNTVTADLGGQTLVSGVYTGGALALTGTVVLDAQGDPNAVWVFQAASSLITASSSRVSLLNGADACNVFWQVTSSATLGTDSTFVGTVLALTSITANTDATIAGRLLARTGAVTLDSNTFTSAACSASAVTTTTATGGTTATTTANGGTTATTTATGDTTATTTATGDTTATTTANGDTTTMVAGGVATTTFGSSVSTVFNPTIPSTGTAAGVTATVGIIIALLGALTMFAVRRPRPS